MSEIVGSAEVEVFPDTTQFGPMLKRSATKAGRDSGRAFSTGFKKNLAAVTGGVLAAGGISALIGDVVRLGKESVAAASERAGATILLEKALKNANAEQKLFGKTLEQVLEDESRITGFTDDELNPSFRRLVSATKDSALAFDLLRTSQDVARQRQIGLSTAAIAVAKAQQGSVTSLQRLGVVLPGITEKMSKQEKAERAIAELRKRFGGSALAFAESDAGQLERFNVAVGEIKEELGKGLLPLLARGSKAFADFFARPENQQKVTNAVQQTSQAVSDTVKVAKFLVSPFTTVAKTTSTIQSGIFKIVDAENALNRSIEETLRLRDSESEVIKRQTAERLKLIQLNRAEDARFQGARDLAKQAARAAAPPTVDLGPLRGPATGFDVERLRAEQTKTNRDDLALFRDRREFLENQVKELETAGVRGKNDKARLVALYQELSGITSDINSIEGDIADQRKQAAEDRKQAIEDAKKAAQEEREAEAERRRLAAEAARDAKERVRSLKDARLNLRVQQAELTKTNTDDIKAQQSIIRYYSQQARQFRKQGALLRATEAQSNVLTARARIQDLRKQGKTGSGAASPMNFFAEAAQNFRAFGSNIAGRRGVLSGQDARGAFAGLALDRRSNTQNLMATTVTQQLQQAQVTNELLRSIRNVLTGTARAAGSQAPVRVSRAADQARRFTNMMGGPT